MKDLTDTVVWDSSDQGVAAVDRFGVVTANASGEATVTATTAGISASAKLSVISLGSYVYAAANNAPGGNPELPADVPVVAQFAMNADGTVHGVAPFLVGVPFVESPPFYWITRAPGSRFVYVPLTDGSLVQFTADLSGRLSLATPSQLVSPDLPRFHPSGHYAYTFGSVNYQSNWIISRYSVAPDGHLSHIAPDLDTAPYQIISIILHPSGLYLYALATTAPAPPYVTRYYLVLFSIAADGALVRKAVLQVHAEQGFLGQSPDCQRLMAAPNGRFLYVPCAIATVYPKTAIYQYEVAADGSLTPARTAAADTPAGAEPVVIDPRGKYAYGRGTIFAFEGGSLRQIGTWSAPSIVNYVIDGAGRYLYQANGSMNVYSIGSNGIPVQVSSVSEPPPLYLLNVASTY